jgi:hypothetical protein
VTEASTENLELSISLPLGAVANQLMRIEADLRFLNMKALAYAKEGENAGPARQIAARLEKINEALDRIRGLVSDIEADVQPRPARPISAPSREPASLKPLSGRDD